MGRSRYKIVEPTHPHFLTCTVLHWLPIFTNQESVQIIIDSLSYLQENDNMTIFSYVILEKNNATTLLKQFSFHKKAHRKENTYQLWEERFHPQLIQSEGMMFEKINYIHQNPVKRGYIDEAEHWRYSSARDYHGVNGLLEVERL